MKALREGDEKTLLAFNERMWGFVPDRYPEVDYQAAFLPGDTSDFKYYREVIIDSMNLFEKLFGYRAEFFVPPNGYFNSSLNKILAENGIRFRFASKLQYEPLGGGKYKRVFHYNGQKDKNKIRYIIRNCFFEPSLHGKDWVDSCLCDIELAFRWKKPAIISTHRVNYIGALNVTNRDRGLRQLADLLDGIIKNWPDAEFLTTPQLGRMMD
jgi:hypothetical protein